MNPPDRMRHESEARLAGIIDSAMDAIVSVDDQQRIVVFNAAAEKIFGLPAAEAIGQPLDRFIPERYRAAHREHLQGFGQTHVSRRSIGHLGPLAALRANGEEFPIEASVSQVEIEGRRLFTVILRDITEKRRAETQLLHAQRLESVGTLAGGLAHDLNNILAPIMVSVRLLERKLAGDPEGLECVALLGQLADRGANIVRQVLSFARGMEGERVPVQLKHVVREVVEMLRETLPRSITIHQDVSGDLWIVNADATQLHQVLMNLAVNSRDAMPQGGTLTITARNREVTTGAAASFHPEARTGRYVELSVADTGTGIASDHLERIFDPFFTTKPPGQGTGLGLSTTLGIVRAHDGFVTVDSVTGAGSTFTVHLPAQIATEVVPATAPDASLPHGHGEWILVVDDERPVRVMTGRTLEEFGYRVLMATDGPDAIRVFAEHPNEIGAVVLDMTMPHMDGAATAAALRAMNPDARLIGSSGMAEPGRRDQTGFRDFLPKPYTADQLLAAVANALKPSRT